MSHEELRAAHQRLKAQVAELLKADTSKETRNPAVHQLLEDMQALTQEYDEKLTEAEAQIAELKRELFGPKAVNYFINEYEALKGYLRDGRFEIDNNLVYAVRGISAGMPTSGLCP